MRIFPSDASSLPVRENGRCTDIGTRVIVAIRIDDHPDDPSWYNGPPYAVAESVFDEYDQQGSDFSDT